MRIPVPSRWRDSVGGDLEEERRARVAAGRRAGAWWWLSQAVRIAPRLWIEELSVARIPPIRRTGMIGMSVHIRQSARALIARPAYSLAIVATLAIGIGANEAVFGLANWLLLRPVPGVHAPDRLVSIRFTHPSGAVFTIAHPEIDAIRGMTPALAAAAGSIESSFHVVAASNAPERVAGEIVSANYFEVLGVRPPMGRAFSASTSGIVVSHSFWRTRLGGSPNAIGTTILVNGKPHPILGVAPPGFSGISRSRTADLWAPTTLRETVLPNYRVDPILDIRAGLYFLMIGRLADGASIDDLRASLDRAPAELAKIHPRPQRYRTSRFVADQGLTAASFEQARLRGTFLLLTAIVALLLVLTCANVGNVMLASGSARRSEFATRQALGAGRRQIIWGVLLESLMLSTAGGLTGVGLAAIVNSLLRGTMVLPYLPELGPVALDARVLLFALGASTFAAVAAGLLPAWTTTRVDLITVLNGTGRSIAAGGSRLRRILIVAQVAVSLTLLVGGLLLARSLGERRRADPGFDTAPIVTFSVEPGLQGQDQARRRAFYTSLMSRLSTTPGIVSAAIGWSRPFGLMADDAEFHAIDGTSREVISADEYTVGPRYLQTMGIGLIEGREFEDRDLPADDDAREGVVIISAAAARQLFGASSAVGRTLEMSYPQGARRVVIGVARDARLRRAFEPPGPALYSPIDPGPGRATIHIRAAIPPEALAPALREAVRQADPSLPLYDLLTVRAAIDRQMSDEILVGRLTMAFAAMASVLAAIGLYGVLAQAVVERRRELGVRVALGAAPGRVLGLIAADALRLTLVGAALGLGASLWLTAYIENRLFGIDRFDPVAIGAALAVTLAAAGLAAALPAWRAARVDPASILRV